MRTPFRDCHELPAHAEESDILTENERLAPEQDEAGTGNGPTELPSSVSILEAEGRTVYLVGTAHVSRQSLEDVRNTIELVRPDTVCLELDAERYRNLTDPQRWKQTNIGKIIREGKAALLLSSLVMSSFQRRIGKKLGVTPGAEMAEGARAGEALGAEISLIDRDIQLTLKRTWRNLDIWNKSKIMFQLVTSLFAVDDVDENTIEELKEQEKLGDILQIFGEQFPQVKKPLIDERDQYMAQKLREAPGRKIVAVVGAGHAPGIAAEIGTARGLEPLETVPPASSSGKALKWILPLLILGLFIWGFYRGGTEESLGSVYIWFLVNGILSALGAAIALGHPLTILSAFLAAPLTSLNPMIAAGWVSGLVQAFVKKPTVSDLEDLPEAINSVRGFWMNPVSRILLVVVFSNLGSVLGTFIAGSWIFARVVG